MITLRKFVEQERGTKTPRRRPRRKPAQKGRSGKTVRTPDERIRGHRKYDYAKFLCRLFIAMKVETFGIPRWALAEVIQEGKGHFTVFADLAERIEQVQEWGVVIDPAEYIRAHFATYGRGTVPTQLVSDWSWALYQSYCAQGTVVFATKEDEDANIAAIQVGRGLSKREATRLYRAVIG